MSGLFFEEEGEERFYRTWKKNTANKVLSESEGSIELNMSNIYPVAGGKSKAKRSLSVNCEEELRTNQETTFTEAFSSSVRLPLGEENDAYWTSTNLEHTSPMMNRPFDTPVLDSKGGTQPCGFFTPPQSSFGQKIPPRVRSTSVSSDAASSTSTSSNYVSDNGSIIDVAGSGGKGRSWSSSSSTGISSSTSTSSTAQHAWNRPDECLALNRNTDSAIEIEDDETMNDLPNEVQPLLYRDHEHIMETRYEGSKQASPPPQQTITCFQPNEVHLKSSQIEKENQNPVLESVVATPVSGDKIRRSNQAPLSEKSSINETVYNLQSVLSYNTPLSQNTSDPEKEGTNTPVLQVMVPVFNKTTSKVNANEIGKKNTNLRKKRSPASTPLSSSHSQNISMPSPSTHSIEAATTATIHHFLSPESSQNLPTIHQPKYSPSTFSSSQENNNVLLESYLQSPHQPYHNQGNIPHSQTTSAFSVGNDYHGSTQQTANLGSAYTKFSYEPSSNPAPRPLNHPVSNSGDCQKNPYLNDNHCISSNLSHDTQNAVVNHPKPYYISNAHLFVSTTPHAPVMFPQSAQCNGFAANGQIQTTPFINYIPQNNSNPEHPQFRGDIQGSKHIQQPLVTFMDPDKFPITYHYGYAPPLAVPFFYGGIPSAGHPGLKIDVRNSGFYPLHQPLPSLPPWLPGPVPQQQYSTSTLAATTESSLSSPMHDPNISSERSACPNDSDTASTHNSYPDRFCPPANQFKSQVPGVTQANHHQIPLQASVTNCGHQENGNSRASDIDVVAMQNHHNTIVSGMSINRPVNSTVVDMSPITRADHETLLSQTDPSSECVEEIYGQPSGQDTSSNPMELSDTPSAGTGEIEAPAEYTDINGQDGPVPTAVADRRNSLPPSIHSGLRQSNSVQSQLPILKDERNNSRTHTSRCYQSLCITSAIVNPVIGLVALLLLYLAARDFKRQRFMRSSHLQLAAIILSTCGIFITLNIMFLLCVPWAVKMGSPLEVVRVGKGPVSNKQLDKFERCKNALHVAELFKSYDFDRASYCTVVWNEKLKNALNVHLRKDTDRYAEWKKKLDDKDREWQKKYDALATGVNIQHDVSGFFGDSQANSNETSEINQSEDVAVSTTTSFTSDTSIVSNYTQEVRKREIVTTSSSSGLPESTDIPELSQTQPLVSEDVKIANDSSSVGDNSSSTASLV